MERTKTATRRQTGSTVSAPFDHESVARSELRQRGQARVLELLATGHPLADVLTALVRLMERLSEGTFASVLLLEGDRFRMGAAPSLPKPWNDAIDGLQIGPAVGSCGTAAFRGERVIVEDITKDPLWAEYHPLATAHGLAACWSEPIRSPDGEVRGTFAMYYGQPRGPQREDLELIGWAAHLAGIAIERTRAEEALRAARDELELRVAERTAALREAQDALQMHQTALAHSARVSTVGEMAAGLAHELNQPLSAILNYSQTCHNALRSIEGVPRACIDDLDGISEQADRAAKIIRRVRLFVRKGETVRDTEDLNAIVDQMLPLMEVEAHRQGVTLHVERARIPALVSADGIQIQQVLLNLVMNGIDAVTVAPDAPRELTISTFVDGGEVAVEVADSGPGVKPEMIESIFEPFFTTKPEGIGLGLSIVRTIIKAHNGHVQATPRPEGGMVFRFSLPGESDDE